MSSWCLWWSYNWGQLWNHTIYHDYFKNPEKKCTSGILESFYNVLLDTHFPSIGKLTHAAPPHPKEFVESYEAISSLQNKLRSSSVMTRNQFVLPLPVSLSISSYNWVTSQKAKTSSWSNFLFRILLSQNPFICSFNKKLHSTHVCILGTDGLDIINYLSRLLCTSSIISCLTMSPCFTVCHLFNF